MGPQWVPASPGRELVQIMVPDMCLSFGFRDGGKPQLAKEQLVQGLLLGSCCFFPGWLCPTVLLAPRSRGYTGSPRQGSPVWVFFPRDPPMLPSRVRHRHLSPFCCGPLP